MEFRERRADGAVCIQRSACLRVAIIALARFICDGGVNAFVVLRLKAYLHDRSRALLTCKSGAGLFRFHGGSFEIEEGREVRQWRVGRISTA